MSLWSEKSVIDSANTPLSQREAAKMRVMGVYPPRRLLDRAAWLAMTVVVATLPLEEASQRTPIAPARRATATVPPTQAVAAREAKVNEMAMVATNMYMKSKETAPREVHTWDWSIPEDGQMPVSRRAEGWPAYDFSVCISPCIP